MFGMNRGHQEARSKNAGRSIRRGGGGAQEGGAYSGGKRNGTLVVCQWNGMGHYSS